MSRTFVGEVGGWKLFEDPGMMVIDKVEYERSLFQRLFSRPWAPFDKIGYKDIVRPDERVRIEGSHSVIGHPVAIMLFAEALAEKMTFMINQSQK